MSNEALNKKVRQTAIALLKQEAGISRDAWEELYELLELTGNEDLSRHVDAVDGEFYLPEDYAEGD